MSRPDDSAIGRGVTRLNQISKGKASIETTEEVKSITTDSEQVDFIETNRRNTNPIAIPTILDEKITQTLAGRITTTTGNMDSDNNNSFIKDNLKNINIVNNFKEQTIQVMGLDDAVIKLISTIDSQGLLVNSRHKQYEEKFSLHEVEFRTQKATLQSVETNSKVYPEPPMPGEEVQSLRREIFTEVPLRPHIARSTTKGPEPNVIPPPPLMGIPPRVQKKERSNLTYHTQEDNIQQIPKYGRFLMEFLTNKGNMEEAIKRTNHCVTLIERFLPKNFLDPRKFSLPCSIGPLLITFALTDLGAGVNAMPYNMFLRLSIGKSQSVNATIELADGLIKSHVGVIENLLVKVGKFVFPVEFIVLEMRHDYSVPLILGRPFLATARVFIDMNEGILTLYVEKQSMTYNIGGNDCLSNDPFGIAQFIDTNLDYQHKKAKEFNKGKKLDFIKDLDNTNRIDEYFDQLPKFNDLNERTGDTGEVICPHLNKD
ncbi:hypothetical protein L1987_37838 [Smallanthus sonchifolius]|uniref:Uncharacterized protein n=1 Tax=Smallanthus sonchifolius TaxID=185202 RepID=A0ACB9HH05_9ASTR|nr:hypothetical protein L1987_37838 [Smallanthus sonchifolius]